MSLGPPSRPLLSLGSAGLGGPEEAWGPQEDDRKEGGMGSLWAVGWRLQPSQDPLEPSMPTSGLPRGQSCLVWVVWPLRLIPGGMEA